MKSPKWCNHYLIQCIAPVTESHKHYSPMFEIRINFYQYFKWPFRPLQNLTPCNMGLIWMTALSHTREEAKKVLKAHTYTPCIIYSSLLLSASAGDTRFSLFRLFFFLFLFSVIFWVSAGFAYKCLGRFSVNVVWCTHLTHVISKLGWMSRIHTNL